jgi:F-box protein 11
MCTAWLVSSEYLVTNHHCIPGEEGVRKAQVVFGYLATTDLTGIRKFDVDVSPVETSTSFDYSVVRVTGKPAEAYGVVKLVS